MTLTVAIGLLQALSAASAPPAQPAPIEWRSGAVQLTATTPVEAAQRLNTTTRADGTHLVVQFARPPSPDQRQALTDAGLRLLWYVGSGAYFASVSHNTDVPLALIEESSLFAVAAPATEWKLHPLLARGDAPPWVASPAYDDDANAAPIIAAYVLCHPDVSSADGRAALHRHEALIQSEIHSLNGYVVELPLAAVRALAAEDEVMYIEPALPPMVGLNAGIRALSGADTVQAAPLNLSGKDVSVMVYDVGVARSTHFDFQSRVFPRDGTPIDNHSTHVTGTLGGAGVIVNNYRGVAPGVEVQSYGFEQAGGIAPGFLYTNPGDLEADYQDAMLSHGAVVANNSIGTNTSSNGFPCSWEGDYGITAALIDAIVGGSLGAPMSIVWANGNERQNHRCGATYHTTAPPACNKNAICVGAVNSDLDSVTWFSSWGPADDGRLKPEICAGGCSVAAQGVFSTSAAGDATYTRMCGTSMAAPAVTGAVAILIEYFRQQYPQLPDPLNSTLKGLLVHAAADLESPGPDYKTGYGSLRIPPAVELIRRGRLMEATLGEGESLVRRITIDPDTPELRTTLVWDDLPGAPNVAPALVNDLDLIVTDPTGVRHYPWTLGGLADPNAPATRTQEDHINNIEQVYVENPVPGTWTITVQAYLIPTVPTTFSLIGDGADIGVMRACPPDLDQDRVIGLADLAILLSNFGAPNPTPADGDLDQDGDVDLVDLATILDVFGRACDDL